MRVVHLCFRLHEPFGLRKFVDDGADSGYFESKAEFAQANAEIYQPLFAFLERNTQKFRGFNFSLLVSGSWLELAERYDNSLIERLRKLVKLGQVELVAEPLHHSLAFFYDKAELTTQVQMYREKIQKLFGVEGRIFALPELIYNDQVGKWAEDFGFAGMLVGGTPQVLGWHSPNHVYEAMECRYLRLLFCNTMLSQMVVKADPELLAEKRVSEESEETKLMLLAKKFQKCLDLEMLRGNLVNLYFDAGIFQTHRSKGVISFFDELVANWLEIRGNHFVGAAQACVVETPSMALSVKESVSWREDVADVEKKASEGAGLVLQSEADALPPRWLSSAEQVEQSKNLYSLRREILASEDEHIIEDWRRLTAVDYLEDMEQANFRAILTDLKMRVEKAKKAQAVEISRAYTKKRDRGDIDTRPAVDNTVVQVNFGKKSSVGQSAPKTVLKPNLKPAQVSSMRVALAIEDGDEASEQSPIVREEVAPVEAEVVETIEVPVQVKPAKPKGKPEKSRKIRKVIRRLVIE